MRFIRGKFLVDRTAEKNWKFFAFLTLLALIGIASSHRADQKVFKIAALRDEVRALKATFISLRSKLQNSKSATQVAREVEKIGLKPPTAPPEVIYIEEQP